MSLALSIEQGEGVYLIQKGVLPARLEVKDVYTNSVDFQLSQSSLENNKPVLIIRDKLLSKVLTPQERIKFGESIITEEMYTRLTPRRRR